MTAGPIITLPRIATESVPAAPPNRGRLVGLVARKEPHYGIASMKAIVKAFTVDLNWGDVEPVEGGPLNLSKLDTYHALAVTDGIPRIRVRLYAGDKAPRWAKTINGFAPLSWAGADGPGGDIGPFWRQDHRDAYYAFTQRLALEIGANYPRVCEITDSTLTTIYAENYLRGWGAMTTAERLSVIDAGYTYQEDEEGNAEAQDRQYALWAPYGISVLHTYNTWQRLMPDGSIQYDLQHTLNMMARWGEKGRFAILFNTGLGAPVDVRGPNDQAIWEAQNNWWPSGVQTMTLTKMRNQFFTDPVSTVQLAIDLGFIDVEIPLGVHNDANELYRIDTTEAATLNAGLAGNVAEGQDP